MMPGAGRVQVDEGGAAGGVAHPFHQLTRVGPSLSHELVTGMAQIVQVDIETSRDERGTPGTAAEVGVPQRHAMRAGETSASASGWVKLSRCDLMSATIREGIETVRLPASARAYTWPMVRTGRSGDFSTDAPLMRHGLRRIKGAPSARQA